LVGLTLLFGEK